MQNERLHRMTAIAIMGSLAFLLMYFGQIKLPFFASFLTYDPGDVPAMVATFTLGPVAGVWVQGIKSLLFWISGKSDAGWVGVLANFLAGVGLVIAAGLTQRLMERAGARAWVWGPVSAAVGAIVMAGILIPLNALVVYPLYGWTGAAAWNGAIYLSTPFNLFKGFISSSISLAFYRRVKAALVYSVARKAA